MTMTMQLVFSSTYTDLKPSEVNGSMGTNLKSELDGRKLEIHRFIDYFIDKIS